MTNLHATENSTFRVQGLPTAENRWAVQCLNCEAPLTGPFCSNCGQRAVPPHPSARELAGDAFAEFSGWDGKFAGTIRTLVQKPGELTRQWLEGRRVRFIAPLRLYLTASVVYFLVQAAVPSAPKKVSILPGPAIHVGKGTNSAPQVASAAVQRALDTKTPLTQAQLDSVAPSVAKAPGLLRPIMLRFLTDPAGVFESMRRLAPRVLFALLPFYAGILALFYHKRHYPEHLYFAVHLHSFVFIALTINGLLKLAHLGLVGSIAALGVLIWIVAYSVLALRRVYAGSIGLNFLKGVGIMALYLLLAFPALLVTVTIAALS
jgi:hypothetical protein